jgi:hypothetical protein
VHLYLGPRHKHEVDNEIGRVGVSPHFRLAEIKRGPRPYLYYQIRDIVGQGSVHAQLMDCSINAQPHKVLLGIRRSLVVGSCRCVLPRNNILRTEGRRLWENR